MKALNLLQEKLVGNFYSRFSIGDTFDLYFDSFWLIAHNVVSYDEENLNRLLLNEYKPVKEAINGEDVSKSLILCSTRQKNIIEVTLAIDSTLQLAFENGVTLLFPTNTDFVDWQWAINEKAMILILIASLGALVQVSCR